MLIRAMADQHGALPKVEPCDLLLIAGDVSPLDTEDNPDKQRSWLRHQFSDWLENIPAERIIGIAGNHDFGFEHNRIGFELPWTYLIDSDAVIDGLRVYGMPWVPNLKGWAFYADDPTLQKKVDAIPDDVDVLVVHGPPNGIADKAQGLFHVGSRALTSALSYRLDPKLTVFGHIHEGHGLGQIGDGIVANVSLVNEFYEHVHEPMEFEVS